jgi:hypothetical protein
MAYALCAAALAVFLVIPGVGELRRSIRRANALVRWAQKRDGGDDRG